MYQAKVEIRQEETPGTFTIIDASIGDETPISREVVLRNGEGYSKTYLFDFSNEILIEGEPQDYAYNIDYIATLDSEEEPTFGSTYSYRLAFLVSNHSEDYLFKLQKEIHCSNGDICNDKTKKDLIYKASEIIMMLNIADLYIEKCNATKAQEALNYINNYIGHKYCKDNKCNCGCSH